MKIHGPFTSWVTWVKWPLVTLRCDFRNSKHSSRSYEAICKLMPLMTLAAALNRTSERPLGKPPGLGAQDSNLFSGRSTKQHTVKRQRKVRLMTVTNTLGSPQHRYQTTGQQNGVSLTTHANISSEKKTA